MASFSTASQLGLWSRQDKKVSKHMILMAALPCLNAALTLFIIVLSYLQKWNLLFILANVAIVLSGRIFFNFNFLELHLPDEDFKLTFPFFITLYFLPLRAVLFWWAPWFESDTWYIFIDIRVLIQSVFFSFYTFYYCSTIMQKHCDLEGPFYSFEFFVCTLPCDLILLTNCVHAFLFVDGFPTWLFITAVCCYGTSAITSIFLCFRETHENQVHPLDRRRSITLFDLHDPNLLVDVLQKHSSRLTQVRHLNLCGLDTFDTIEFPEGLEILNLEDSEFPTEECNFPQSLKVLLLQNSRADLIMLQFPSDLVKLDLGNTNFCNLEEILHTTSLEWLSIADCPIDFAEACALPSRLRHLDLTGTNIASFESIRNLKHLETLNLSYCSDLDLSDRVKFPPDLVSLNVSNTNFMELRSLEGLMLQTLNLENCPVDLNEPFNFPSTLIDLNLSHTNGPHLRSLCHLVKLQRLLLTSCSTPIDDLPFPPNVEVLHLSESIVNSLTSIVKLRKLKRLRLDSCEMETWEEDVRSLPTLESLWIPLPSTTTLYRYLQETHMSVCFRSNWKDSMLDSAASIAVE